MQKCQNTNTTKYKRTKYKQDKIQKNKIQVGQKGQYFRQKSFTNTLYGQKIRVKVVHKTDYADKKGLNVGQNRFLKTTPNLRPIGRLPSPLKQLDWSENNAQ